jgi:putative effector of murein hydrolase LrgA (UPF0299 family)
MPLLRLFVDICMLRAAPQDLPASPLLLRLALFGYLFAGLLALVPNEGPVRATGMVAVDLAVMLVLLFAVLQWRGHPARFNQAACALLGTGALLGLLLLPVLLLAHAGEALAGLAFPLWLALFVWGLTVTGHILRHALDLTLAGGVLGAVLYFAASLALIQGLFPGTGGE